VCMFNQTFAMRFLAVSLIGVNKEPGQPKLVYISQEAVTCLSYKDFP